MNEDELTEEDKKGSITRNLCNEAIDKLPTNMGFYRIYADNYYGGLELAEDTNKRGYGFTFASKATRPSFLFKNWMDQERAEHSMNNLKDFACRTSTETGITAISWKDKANVRYLTNQYSNESVKVFRRTHFSDVKIQETIPAAAYDYSKFGMGHVDAFDKHLVTCAFTHKNVCWRRTHFLTMLKMTLVNCWRFYKVQQSVKADKKVKISQKEFLQILQQQMLAKWKEEKESEALVKSLKRRAKDRERQAAKRAKTTPEVPHTSSFKLPSQRAQLFQNYMQQHNKNNNKK